MKRTSDWLLLNRWLWITIFGCTAVTIGPIVIVYLIALMPATLKVVSFLAIATSWGVASGYKDWAIAKRKEEKILLRTPET